MPTRRDVLSAMLLAPGALLVPRSWSQPPALEDGGAQVIQLDYPPFADLDRVQEQGLRNPDGQQIDKAREIVDQTPHGPHAIDIAQSFVDRFAKADPEAIAQWPLPAAWNPLVVEFFHATSYKANNDMIAWCAAFANWCITRAGGTGSNRASSQSFLADKCFKRTNEPDVGDLVVFTCYDKAGRNTGLGHVAFVREKPAEGHVRLVGGNQSADGHSSIISEKTLPTTPFVVKRHIGTKYVACTMRINAYMTYV